MILTTFLQQKKNLFFYSRASSKDPAKCCTTALLLSRLHAVVAHKLMAAMAAQVNIIELCFLHERAITSTCGKHCRSWFRELGLLFDAEVRGWFSPSPSLLALLPLKATHKRPTRAPPSAPLSAQDSHTLHAACLFAKVHSHTGISGFTPSTPPKRRAHRCGMFPFDSLTKGYRAFR